MLSDVPGEDDTNPCVPAQASDYTGFDSENDIWSAADCDSDGISNGDEAEAGTNPYEAEPVDLDGDGVLSDVPGEMIPIHVFLHSLRITQASIRKTILGAPQIVIAMVFLMAMRLKLVNPYDPLSFTIDPDGDEDGDGILNKDEDLNGNGNYDDDNVDGDEFPNYLDIDDDNDGVFSLIERFQNTQNNGNNDTDDDFFIDPYDPDDDGDGIPTIIENQVRNLNGISEFDGDNKRNYLDFDDDGDGIPTKDEGGSDGTYDQRDNDQDGLVDYLDEDDTVVNPNYDYDGDGILNGEDTSHTDPCLPEQEYDYDGYDENNPVWQNADCDGDGEVNGVDLTPYGVYDPDIDGDGNPNDSDNNPNQGVVNDDVVTLV